MSITSQDSKEEPRTQHPRRCRLAGLCRWSIIGLVLFVGGGFSWALHRGHAQQTAVALIRGGGGYVFYDWELRHGRYDPGHFLWQVGIQDPNGKPPWPQWLVSLLGVDSLTDVKMAHIGPKTPDAVMKQIGGLRALEELTFDGQSPLTDAGMAHVRGLTDLKVLLLPNSQITGRALASLSGLTRLQTLNIPAISLESADLSALRGMTDLKDFILTAKPAATGDLTFATNMNHLKLMSLRGIRVKDLAPILHLPDLLTLQLADAEIDDACLAPLQAPGSLPNLVVLFLVNTRITDAGLKPLRNLRRLATLSLEGTPITDAGVVELAAMNFSPHNLSRTKITDAGVAILVAKHPQLNSLDVSYTQITDAGLKHLERLRHAIELKLKGTQVTDAGVAQFQKVHPHAKIDR